MYCIDYNKYNHYTFTHVNWKWLDHGIVNNIEIMCDMYIVCSDHLQVKFTLNVEPTLSKINYKKVISTEEKKQILATLIGSQSMMMHSKK